MTFGEKILLIRKDCNWSQHDLAKKINSHAALIGKYERNEIKPSIDVAKKLADALSTNLDYLLDTNNSTNKLQDKKVVKRIEEIESLPKSDKDHLYYLIDSVIRDVKTRKAYSN